jgi:hypothetical protein
MIPPKLVLDCSTFAGGVFSGGDAEHVAGRLNQCPLVLAEPERTGFDALDGLSRLDRRAILKPISTT